MPPARATTDQVGVASGSGAAAVRILQVDDDPAFLALSSRLLEGADDRFEVETETDAAAALERLRDDGAGDVDCVVSDYQMPGTDGIEFLEAVRERDLDVPFILFTGRGSEEVASEAISAGVTDYLQKPAGSDQFAVLVDRIESAVDHARAERRLEETRRQFRTLVANLPGMAYRCANERGRPMAFVSDGCAALTGYEGDDLVDGSVEYGDLIHPEDRERVWEGVRDAVAAREPFRLEYRIGTADGAEKRVWERGCGVFEDGEVVALEGFVTDADWRTTDARLRFESSLLEAQVETTLDGVFVVDDEGGVPLYNDRFVEMWGVPEERVRAGDAEAVLEWIAENAVADAEAFRADVEVLDDAPAETERAELTLTDGRVFDQYAAPVEGDDGTYYGRLWLFRDITERVERERELDQERERYATLVERSHDGVAILQDGDVVFANPRMAALVGYDEDGLVGTPLVDLVDAEDRERAVELYERRLDPGAVTPPSRYELTLRTAAGERRGGEISAARVRYGDDPAVLVSVRDVTDRRADAKALERANEELELLNRVVRHDIRNDMTGVLGWSDFLEDHVDEEGREYLEKVRACGERVVELTEIARDHVEVLTAGEALDVEPTPLRPAVETEISRRRDAHPGADIAVVDDVPNVDVSANGMLPSVFRNLLDNAVKHADGADATVEVSARTGDETVTVTVADDGPGVPEARREAIFEKGERSLESDGTGMGLYLVRTLVEQYGGEVSVEDGPLGGAAFSVTLPLAE